uniref:Uncharacterized protein n=1 Tax=Meloidogyne javanica TaxID=6303 RepID=A0A915LVQ4_MELJA
MSTSIDPERENCFSYIITHLDVIIFRQPLTCCTRLEGSCGEPYRHPGTTRGGIAWLLLPGYHQLWWASYRLRLQDDQPSPSEHGPAQRCSRPEGGHQHRHLLRRLRSGCGSDQQRPCHRRMDQHPGRSSQAIPPRKEIKCTDYGATESAGEEEDRIERNAPMTLMMGDKNNLNLCHLRSNGIGHSL